MKIASAEEMQAFGRRLAAELPAFAVIVLVGELGAGKTVLTKGLAEGWGVATAEQITSPTYTLIHEFQHDGRRFYHLDLYRIETAAQLATLGLEDLWRPPEPGGAKLVVIEWGEKIESELPRPYLRLSIASTSADVRELTLAWVR